MTRTDIACIAPFFIVRSVPAALAFYRDRLGFEVTFEGPAPNDIFFGIVERGDARIMFNSKIRMMGCADSRSKTQTATCCISAALVNEPGFQGSFFAR